MNNLISILLPNLNNREFLEERIESIYKQTCSEWELIVVDSYSDDGAWEFFKNLAAQDSRVKIYQSPREGIYAGWNECIRQATGRYVYFATSDDTMADNCLEKLSTALDKHPECGLAHCNLKLFDENSQEMPQDWWWDGLFAQSSQDYVQKRHIRKAPFDGLLHLYGATVYISITQLMIRGSLFDKIGYFPTDRGSTGDFQWVMKATLITDTVHVPDTWGGWRQHRKQATELSSRISAEHWQTIESMSLSVLRDVEAFMKEPALSFIRKPTAMSRIRKERIRAEYNTITETIPRLSYLLGIMRKDPRIFSELIMDKVRKGIGLKRIEFPADWVVFLRNNGIVHGLRPIRGHCNCSPNSNSVLSSESEPGEGIRDKQDKNKTQSPILN